MRTTPVTPVLLALGLAAVACTPPAFAQSGPASPTAKAVAVDMSSAPEKPSIPAISADLKVTAADTTPLTTELAQAAKPTVDWYNHIPAKTPPQLACPAGTTLAKNVTDTSWEVYCARGAQKHGPYRSLDKKALRELRAEYQDDKLHGLHVEIRIKPVITSKDGAQDDLVAEARKAVEAGWPLAPIPDPTCPTGTTLKRDADANEVMCALINGTPHGMKVRTWGSTNASWTTMILGKEQLQGGSVTLTDQRTVRETTYERGELTRVLETGYLSNYLEIHRGEDVALLQCPGCSDASLSRMKNGKLHGEQLVWKDGKLLSVRTFRDGVEHGPGLEMPSGYPLQKRLFDGGKGVVETDLYGGRKVRCRMEGDKQTLCETVDAKGQLLRREELLKEAKIITEWQPGGPKTSSQRRPNSGSDTEDWRWNKDGKPEQHSVCNRNECTVTTWDAQGRATTQVIPQSGSSDPAPLVSQMNAVAEILTGAAPKPAAKVAAP